MLPPRRRTLRRASTGLAAAATVGTVAAGVALGTPGGFDVAANQLDTATTAAKSGDRAQAREANQAASATAAAASVSSALKQRELTRVSRSAERAVKTEPRKLVVKQTLWATADLNQRLQPSEASAPLPAEVKEGTKVATTGETFGPYTEVLVKGQPRWVTTKNLSAKEPNPEPKDMPVGGQPCAGTSGVESGLQPDAVRVYRAVCNNFPQVKTYGGYAARGEHGGGKAIDIMIYDRNVGNQIAEFLRANASELNLYNVIYWQRIWTPARSSEGWRSMSNRGGVTANHQDHVHVATN